MLEGVPLALGGEAAAHILDDHHVAARRALLPKRSAVVLVVGGARQQNRILALRNGPVDVGPQGYAVARLHGHSALDNDLRRNSRGRRLGARRGGR